jgi:hypothetical protein
MKKLFLLSFVIIGLVSCQYEFIEIEEVEGTISFSEQVIPIFEAKCTSCHSPTGTMTSIDLSADVAYQTIVNKQYIDLDNPEQSIIYDKAIINHGSVYSNTEAQTVLLWIQQGALDN